MVSKIVQLVGVTALITSIGLSLIGLPLPWTNNKTPKNFKTLFDVLQKGYDVAYSSKINKCFTKLTTSEEGGVIGAFRYFNDKKFGAQRIEYASLNLQKNKTSQNYVWNYWRENAFPNETINIYTSDFAYEYDDEKNVQSTECSFDQFDYRVVEYVQPTNLNTYAKLRQSLVEGKIVRLRVFFKSCEYRGNDGSTTAPDIVEGAILQNYQIYPASSGLQEYIQYVQNSNFQNTTSTNNHEMLTNLNDIQVFQNGTAIFNTYIFDTSSRKNTYTSWAKCQISQGSAQSGITFYTSDHGFNPFKLI